MTDEATQSLKDVGARIRQGREAAGLRLHELALLSGFSAPALSLIETGKRDLRLSSLFRLAAALRLNPADLIQDAGSGDEVSASEAGYDLGDYA